ncbi:hypothetical protein DFJ77DRAFT_444691 [Powellomyces hirtus]|nr:hypothetical protein DFJ77DRAFT_444691 [Powellomyces hirtus]
MRDTCLCTLCVLYSVHGLLVLLSGGILRLILLLILLLLLLLWLFANVLWQRERFISRDDGLVHASSVSLHQLLNPENFLLGLDEVEAEPNHDETDTEHKDVLDLHVAPLGGETCEDGEDFTEGTLHGRQVRTSFPSSCQWLPVHAVTFSVDLEETKAVRQAKPEKCSGSKAGKVLHDRHVALKVSQVHEHEIRKDSVCSVTRESLLGHSMLAWPHDVCSQHSASVRVPRHCELVCVGCGCVRGERRELTAA